MSPPSRLPIAVRIKLTQPHGPAPQPLHVHLGFRNDGQQPLLLWTRLVMRAGRMGARRFTVAADGAEVPWIGPLTVWPAPTRAEFETLAPGQVVLSKVPISQYYALPPRGRVEVTFDAFNPSVGAQGLARLRSNTAAIEIG